MKIDVMNYVSKFFMWQQVKAEHQVPSGLLNLIPIPLTCLTCLSV